MVDVPPVVRNRAFASGAAGWLDGLPGLVADLEGEWSMSVGQPFEDPTEAFVAEVTMDDGRPAVLKLLVPGTRAAARHEIEVLRRADGDGCARLYRHDLAQGALLVERLGRPLVQLDLPIGRRHEILCDVAAKVWRAAADSELPTGAEKARWHIVFVPTTWEELDRPCSEAAVDHALAAAARRLAAHDDERAVLVHGDVHQWNVLEADGGFKLIDPDGLLAEAECDLGVIMREDPVELLDGDPFQRARWLARRTGLDATAIWEWGVVERVATGLLGTKVGLQPVAGQMLATAERLAVSP